MVQVSKHISGESNNQLQWSGIYPQTKRCFFSIRATDIFSFLLFFLFLSQVAARSFGIPLHKIHISETSTNTVANTSPTAASASSDLNGMAVKVRHLVNRSLFGIGLGLALNRGYCGQSLNVNDIYPFLHIDFEPPFQASPIPSMRACEYSPQRSAMLMLQNNETVAMLMSLTNHVGIQLFSYINTSFCCDIFSWLLPCD